MDLRFPEYSPAAHAYLNGSSDWGRTYLTLLWTQERVEIMEALTQREGLPRSADHSLPSSSGSASWVDVSAVPTSRPRPSAEEAGVSYPSVRCLATNLS